MGRDQKYGQVETEHGSIPDDEPVFLLRAQDKCAVPTMVAYYSSALKEGATTEFCDDVVQALNRFNEWKGHRKVPD